jgi:hypothetical protein
MTPSTFAVVNALVFAGFLVRGFTGFGAVLFILPLLALWLPLKEAVPLLAGRLGAPSGAGLTNGSQGRRTARSCG